MAPSEGKGRTQQGRDELSLIKRKLAWRMGIAGLMIVALLGGLVLFDRLATGPGEPELSTPRFTEPVPVPKKSVTQALGSVETASSGEKAEKSAAAPEATAVPADRAAPAAALPPPPEVAAHPSSARSAKQPSRPEPATAPTAAAGRAAEPKGGLRAADPSRSDLAAAGPSPSQPGQRQPPALPKLLTGYTLQAGVFADPRRAEDLHARLTQEGIPATIETRVLVGPFRDRGEAEAARAKMLVMGIDALQLPRSGRK